MTKRAFPLNVGGSKGKLSFFTKEMLLDLYWNQKKSYSKIAKEFNVTQAAVIYQARKFGIKSRTVKIASQMANTGERNPAKRPEVKEKLSGVNNHFYGRTHSEKTKKKMSEGQKLWDRSEWKKIRWTDERRQEFSENNPMKDPEIRQKHFETMQNIRHKFAGKNSSRWKGGVTPLHKKIRDLPEYKSWRKRIYNINGRKCCFCKTNTGPFQVDHIKPFASIITENKISLLEQAKDCAELWDLSNGRVLCVPCHQNTETFGGKI